MTFDNIVDQQIKDKKFINSSEKEKQWLDVEDRFLISKVCEFFKNTCI